MSYLFNEEKDSITNRICNINNIDHEKLDVSNFFIDKDMDIVDRFIDKIKELKDHRFLIVGDYDCDGICATTIMSRLLNYLNIENNYYIPSRSKQGYGLNNEIVDNAYNNGFKVILCVDNGVSAVDELKKAHELGIYTLIIDHHEYEKIPDVDGFIHPFLFDEKYNNMCASGLCALISSYIYDDELSVVYGGLATMADMVSVFDYNRYLIKKMMDILNNNVIAPINYLSGSNNITYESLIFNVIPKINGVSRMDDMMNVNYVVKYLLNNDDSCLKYLKQIEDINILRKNITNEMYSLSTRIIDESKDVIVVKSERFKEGICGIVANRLMHELNKPVIVFSVVDNELRGSGRSINDTNLYDYLNEISELFESFGGHAQAVGLSIKQDRYDQFMEYIETHPFDYQTKDKDVLLIDIDEADEKLLNEIEDLKPFGVDFKEPLLGIKDVRYSKKYIISNRFPKYVLNDKLQAISFNQSHLDVEFDTMIGRLQKDAYNARKLSFIIEDLI